MLEKVMGTLILSRYLRVVKLPPQNSTGAKKLGGRLTVSKRLIKFQLIISGDEQNPQPD